MDSALATRRDKKSIGFAVQKLPLAGLDRILACITIKSLVDNRLIPFNPSGIARLLGIHNCGGTNNPWRSLAIANRNRPPLSLRNFLARQRQFLF